MKNILFVCHGNICRSPMAEFVFKRMARNAQVSDWYEVASAALSEEELGNPVYPLARRELAVHGIGCAGKVARQITHDDYEHFDLIVGMDASNMRMLHNIFPDDPDGKLHMLLDYTDKPRDIADPWYTRDFHTAWRDIHAGCEALFNLLLSEAEAGMVAIRAEQAAQVADKSDE